MSAGLRSFRGAAARLGPAAAALSLLVFAAAAWAQDDRFPRPSVGITGTVAQAAYAPATPAWSGEPGSSGDPSMMPDAIRAAAANFHHCLESLWPLAARRGAWRRSFEPDTVGLEPDLRIMDLLDAQPEFTKSFWDYLDLLVSEERIAKGREILATHRATFDAVEKAYGVDRHIVTAIWGI